jgi:hypothetical protein
VDRRSDFDVHIELKTLYFYYRRPATLINPVSKAILQKATKADCYFFSKSNIVDYLYDYILLSSLFFFTHVGSFLFRLLLSIDEERKQIHCGLVNNIGSYTFVKILEYKAKGLGGKKVKISRLPLLTSTKNALCPLWIAISWRVHVRKCAMWGLACFL